MFQKNKKGVFDQMISLFIGLATIAIVSTVMFIVVAQGQDQIVSIDSITNESDTASLTTAYNATVELQDAMSDIPGWIPLIVITVLGGILISLVAVFKSRMN